MEDVERVDVLYGHQQLDKELENVLERARRGSGVIIRPVDVSPPSSYLLFHQRTIPVLYKLKESSSWSVLHYNHETLLLHKVVKVGNDVWMFQNGQDLDLHKVT